MKRRLAAFAGALIVLIALAGCSGGSLDDAVKARKACHAAHGRFDMWQTDFGDYRWSCDLSDREPTS